MCRFGIRFHLWGRRFVHREGIPSQFYSQFGPGFGPGSRSISIALYHTQNCGILFIDKEFVVRYPTQSYLVLIIGIGILVLTVRVQILLPEASLFFMAKKECLHFEVEFLVWG